MERGRERERERREQRGARERERARETALKKSVSKRKKLSDVKLVMMQTPSLLVPFISTGRLSTHSYFLEVWAEQSQF